MAAVIVATLKRLITRTIEAIATLDHNKFPYQLKE